MKDFIEIVVNIAEFFKKVYGEILCYKYQKKDII